MRKGVILVVVMGVMVVLSALALIALYYMTNESRIAEHKIKRMRAIFTAQGGIVHAFERLRREGTAPAKLAQINQDKPALNGLTADIQVTKRGPNQNSPCPSTAPSDFCVSSTVDY